MIRPLDNGDAIEESLFKRNKIMRKQINNLIIALAFISTLGCLVGCVKKERERTDKRRLSPLQPQKKIKKPLNKKQLAYLKEHEKRNC